MNTSGFIHSAMGMLGLKEKLRKMIVDNNFSKEPDNMPGTLLKNFHVQSDVLKNRKVWTISSKNAVSGKVLLYLHGGAYCFNLNRQQWRMIEQIVLSTDITVVVPDYPLAPENTCQDAFIFMDELYNLMWENYADSRISFIGDSAGAGLALAFAQSLRNRQLRQPDHLILFSPWLDVSMSNPDLILYDKKDNMLSLEGLKIAGLNYAGGVDVHDYQVSPLYGDFNDLGTISIFTGTNDLLHPDSYELKKILQNQKAHFNYFEYPEMFHDWVIVPALKESKEVIRQVAEILR